MILCSSQYMLGLYPITYWSMSPELMPLNLTPNFIFLSLAFWLCMFMTFSTVSLMLNLVKFFLNLPALI